MRKVFEFLMDFCWHDYQAKEKIRLVGSPEDAIGYGTRYVYQCSKCFKLKKVDLL